MAAMKSVKLYLPLPLWLILDFSTKPYVFGIKEYNKTHENFIRHYYHAKFKTAAMKSLMLPYPPKYFRWRFHFLPNHIICFRYQVIQWITWKLYGHHYHAKFKMAAINSPNVIKLSSIIEIDTIFCHPTISFWYVWIQKQTMPLFAIIIIIEMLCST